MWRLARVLGVCLAWACCAPAVEELATVFGSVVDPARLAVEAAEVTLTSEDTGFRRQLRTNAAGEYYAASLQPGSYKVSVRKDGFRSVVRFGVRVQAGSTSQINFDLSLGSVRDEITVSSEPPQLQREAGAVGTFVGQEWIRNLPLNGRGLLNLLEMAPGLVVTPATRGEAGQFSVNGQRPNAHYFELDGVSLNTGVLGGGQPAQPSGGSLPAMSAFGSYHNLIGLDALEEFRVRTSSAAPAIGRLPGAQVSLVSKSGGNQFHGGLFFYGRNAELSANDWFANRAGFARGPLHLLDAGFSLGGPVRRDRTFFFVSGDRMTFRQPGTWINPVPTMETRLAAPEEAQPLMGLFPVSNGAGLNATTAEWIGRSDRRSSLVAPNVRLDHAITNRITAFGRLSGSRSDSDTGGFQRNQLRSDFASGMLGLTAAASSWFVSDTRFSYAVAAAESTWQQSGAGDSCTLQQLAARYYGANTQCSAFVRFSVGGLGQLLSGRETKYRQPQWNIVQSAAITLGSHQFRIGGDYRSITPQRLRQGEVVNIMADSLQSLLAKSGLWLSNTSLPPERVVARELSLFLQDTWQLRRTLTFNYGLRWEWGPPPVSTAGDREPRSLQSLPVDKSLWNARLSNVSPRGGIAWRVRPATVVRIGGGLYFDSSLSVTSDLLNVAALPYSLWQVAAPSPEVSGPARSLVSYGFAPDLRLPRVWQWNAGVEHALSRADVISLTYAGSHGRGLLRREVVGSATNLLAQANLTNHGRAQYNSLQAQWRRRLSSQLQANASYAYSYSADNGSSDAVLNWIPPAGSLGLDRGRSDFDVRHAFNLALRYESGSRNRWLRRWAVDSTLRARSGFPINVQYSESAMGVMFANAFRPDLVAGQPVWLDDPQAPGGRRLNRDAFAQRPNFEQGNLRRNSISGFGMSQVDTALSREFTLPRAGRALLRLEAFNLLNQANVADPMQYLASPRFGEAASMLNLGLGNGTPASGLSPVLQIGGPRSVQVSLRWSF